MSNKYLKVHELASGSRCQLHAPGHKVHWIQAQIKRDEPKIGFQIKLLDLNRLEITAIAVSKAFLHHHTELIAGALDRAVNNHIQMAIRAKLLQIQTELPSDIHSGAYALFLYCKLGHQAMHCPTGCTKTQT
jgi:hypothetical protein